MFRFVKIISILLFISITLYPGSTWSQPTIDDIKPKTTNKDTTRIAELLKLCWSNRNSNPEESVKHGLEAIELATKNNDYTNLAKAHSFVGVAYRILGNYSQSIDHYFIGLDIATKNHVEDQEGYAYINIANLHIYQEHYIRAKENLDKALAIALKTKNNTMLAYVYLNIGRNKQLMFDLDSALFYYEQALEIRIHENRIPEQAVCYKYIGDIYFEKGMLNKALDSYKKSVEKVLINEDKDLYANILIKIAEIDFKNNRVEKSLSAASEALNVAKQIGARLAIRDASKVLANLYLKIGDHRMASSFFQDIINYNDTLFSQQLSEKIYFVEYQLDKERKQNKIDLLNKDNLIKELELFRARTFNVTLSVILLLVAGLLTFTFISLQYRKGKNKILVQQNQEIDEQRIRIEQKNQNLEEAYNVIERYIGKITDSIRYAERIQEAILPQLKVANQYFSDAFRFYKPKDFVSGDFYWLSSKENLLYIAVADCTGHGVPGAFMSIIGMDLLNQAVYQQREIEPIGILSFLNVELPKKLKKDEEEVILKDSMDIAVCSVDTSTGILRYCGALIPLTVVRHKKIIRLKSNYTSIGSSVSIFKKEFEQHEFKLQEGDWIYLFSDGFMDQTGGDMKKKFMRKRFEEMIVTLSQYSGDVQADEMNSIFASWKGNNEQIDDVLVFGLKV